MLQLHVMLRTEVNDDNDIADSEIKTLAADNKEWDDGDSLLADNGDNCHGADVRDEDEVHVATNAGDLGDCDADVVTAFD